MLVERTVSRWKDGRWVSEGERLADLRSVRGYVLLGEPGSGKSTAFEEEAKRDENAGDVTARRFTRRSLGAHPEWRVRTLFIDGLDEVRARGGDPHEPLDTVVCRLEELGKPRFRLSCREDSWLGRSDFRELSSVVDGEDLHLLRLDPLSGEHAAQILTAAGVPDSDSFQWNAKDRGLAAFLGNPLLLDVLVKAQESGFWPEGRLGTFERACEALVREANREHLDALDGAPFADEEVVLAAGRLCAILLICDKSGWSRRGLGDEEHPALSRAGQGQPLLKFALDTKIFEGGVETGRSPRHRPIAEFLAAKYLDHAIRQQQLPAGRVLAWMKGVDGMVLPDMRGVSVWLAARNPAIRRPIIASDPVGIAFHGDAEGFGREDTAILVTALEAQLQHQLSTQQWESASSASLGALMTGPGREILYDMLRGPDRSEARHQLVQRLLRGLGEATLREARSGTPGFEDARRDARRVLVATVQDSSWHSYVRGAALAELVRVLGDLADGPSILLDMLNGLATGDWVDTDEGTLGFRLLNHLYPEHLGPERIWDLLVRLWSRRASDAPLRWVWGWHLADKSAPDDVKTLLETLVAQRRTVNRVLARKSVPFVVGPLLNRGLELFGEEMNPAELYDWFELVRPAREWPVLVLAHCEPAVFELDLSVRFKHDWLRDHRDIQLALVLEGLKRTARLPRDRPLDHEIGVKFLGDRAPPGFRQWCLEIAVSSATAYPASAIELAFWTVTEREAWGPPLGDAEILSAVQDTPLLLKWHEQRVAELRATSLQVRERRRAYLAPIHEQLSAIQAGRGPPEMLHELGRVYLEGFSEAGSVGQARGELRHQLGDEQDLHQGVIRGFRNLVRRRDLPTLEEIVGLHESGRTSPYGAPFLAGLTDEEELGVDPIQPWGQEALERALGFYLLSGLHTRNHPLQLGGETRTTGQLRRPKFPRPRWYRHALATDPQTVADALVAVHRARVRGKEFPDQHLCDLPWERKYHRVGPLAVTRMFAPFPSRCTKPQVASLRMVLWAAIKYMPPDDLRQLVLRRLLREGMDPAQRAMWLGASLLVARETCLPHVLQFMSVGRKTRFLNVLEFLAVNDERLSDRFLRNQKWSTADLVALLKAVGSRLSELSSAGGFGADWRLFPLVDIWLDKLSNRVDEEAVAGLRSLADDPTMKSWRGRLLQARDHQAQRLRMETYTPPSLPEIRDALRGGPPAGPADLTALVSDKLAALADRIRDGNSDPWQQYWHTDPHDPRGRKVIRPKSEDPCRDAILSDLQILLEAQDVDAQPEGHHAEDARSDIMAVHGTHAVVVEIKKTDSKDLWTAIEDQLIARYTRDTRSGGYGIFLVFWFGAGHLRRSPPSGTRPRSPEELRRMLEGLLTREQRRTITVIVVDVSAPAGRIASTGLGRE